MKKLFIILLFFVLTISVKAQFTKPTGAVTIPTYSFFRNPNDSSITIYQGSVNLYNTFVQHFDTVKLSGWVNNRKLLKYRLIGDSILKDGTASNYKLLHKIDSLGALLSPATFEQTITDGEATYSVPFILKPTALVIYNQQVLPNTRWTGSGTNTLTLYIDPKTYDYLKIQN